MHSEFVCNYLLESEPVLRHEGTDHWERCEDSCTDCAERRQDPSPTRWPDHHRRCKDYPAANTNANHDHANMNKIIIINSPLKIITSVFYRI